MKIIIIARIKIKIRQPQFTIAAASGKCRIVYHHHLVAGTRINLLSRTI
jgi:hypothetical protein